MFEKAFSFISFKFLSVKRALLFLLLGAACSNAYSQDSQINFENNFSFPFIKAKYEQQKYIADADISLDSEGEIVIIKDRGVIISQMQPFEVTTVITKDKFTEIMDGNEKTLNAKDNPEVFGVTKTILDVLSTKDKTLENFEYSYLEVDNEACLNLIPKQDLLSRVFTRIELKASINPHYPKSISFISQVKDTTTIKLSSPSFDESALSLEQKALLNYND